MRAQFRNTVLDLAAQDDRLVVVLGDISVYMFKEFWERYPIAQDLILDRGGSLATPVATFDSQPLTISWPEHR